jgi:hypothetical protein
VFFQSYLIAGADPESFRVLGVNFGKDTNAVHFKSMKIIDADISGFIVLDDEYSKDRKHVFWQLRTVTGADVNTFQIIGNGFAKDKNYYFECASILKEAPSDTMIQKIIASTEGTSHKDEEENLLKRIKQGENDAIDELIGFYGENKDNYQAFIWMNIALEKGIKKRKDILDDLETEFEVETLSIAHYEIARLYYEKLQIPQEIDKAKKYIRIAIAEGLLTNTNFSPESLKEEFKDIAESIIGE